MQTQKDKQRLQLLGNILKLVKRRQDNYFKLIDFIKRNIDGLKNQTEQVSIVNNFLKKIYEKQQDIVRQEEVLINQYKDQTTSNKKFIFRLSARIFEIFQASLLRIKGTFFSGQTIQNAFKNFQTKVSQNISQEIIFIGTLANDIIEYSKSKFRNEFKKVNKFFDRLEDGEHLYLKQFYEAQKLQQKDLQIYTQDAIYDRDPTRKRKTPRQNKRSKQKSSPTNNRSSKSPQKSQCKKSSKPNIVNKLMKLYSVIDPSRFQFIQDFVYQDLEEHRSKTINSLLQKNKEISQQISQFYKKIEPKIDQIKNLKQPKSDIQPSGSSHSKEKHKSNFLKSQTNLKGSFIISKQKRIKNNGLFKKVRYYDQSVKQHTQYISSSANQQVSSGAEYFSDTAGTNLNANSQKRQKTATKRPPSRTLIKPKVFPNLTIPQKQELVIPNFDDMDMIKKQNNNNSNKNSRVYVMQSPTVFDDESIKQKNFFVGMARPTKKNVKLIQKKVSKRKSSSTSSRKVTSLGSHSNIKVNIHGQIKQEYKLNNILIVEQIDKNLNTQKPKKQFNLRLKKQNKKNNLLNEKLFIQQTNNQINNYNFQQ